MYLPCDLELAHRVGPVVKLISPGFLSVGAACKTSAGLARYAAVLARFSRRATRSVCAMLSVLANAAVLAAGVLPILV